MPGRTPTPSRGPLDGLQRWPQAAEFVSPRQIPVALGEQSVAREAVLFGRPVTWAYVRIGRIVWGIRAQDVQSMTVLSLAAQSATQRLGLGARGSGSST